MRPAGVPVAFLSDTYFSQSFLESLLLNSGYDGLHRVFPPPAPLRRFKSHGALFAKVAAQLAPPAARHLAHRRPLYSIRRPPRPPRRPPRSLVSPKTSPPHPRGAIEIRARRALAGKISNGRYPRLPTRPNPTLPANSGLKLACPSRARSTSHSLNGCWKNQLLLLPNVSTSAPATVKSSTGSTNC